MKKIFTIIGTTAVLSGAILGLAACGSADNNKEVTTVEEATTVETTETTVIEETAETIVEETEKIDTEDIQKESETIPDDMAGSGI